MFRECAAASRGPWQGGGAAANQSFTHIAGRFARVQRRAWPGGMYACRPDTLCSGSVLARSAESPPFCG